MGIVATHDGSPRTYHLSGELHMAIQVRGIPVLSGWKPTTPPPTPPEVGILVSQMPSTGNVSGKNIQLP